MSQLYKYGFAIIMMWFLSNAISAQQRSNLLDSNRQLAGFVVEYGEQNMGLAALNVKYEYQVILFQAQYQYVVLPKKTWDLHIVVQPQFNLTKFRHVNNIEDESSGFEFGLNVGIQLRKTILGDLLSSYVLASVGPHLVSGVPQRQSDGFVFSDNFYIGINIKLKDKLFLNIRCGARHISNLELKQPNGGVNNLICGAGLLFALN